MINCCMYKEGAGAMQKHLLNIIRILLFICTIGNVYVTYLNLHPWMGGDYSAEMKRGTFGLMLLWFVLYCLMVYKQPFDMEFPYQGEKKALVFFLPLGVLFMNIVLELTLYNVAFNDDLWIGDDIMSKAICILLVLIIISILFYISMKNHIMIWCPASLYCIIYALPGADYTGGLSGVGFAVVLLAGAVIFSIIEYGIMLYINRKTWYIPKADKESNSANYK